MAALSPPNICWVSYRGPSVIGLRPKSTSKLLRVRDVCGWAVPAINRNRLRKWRNLSSSAFTDADALHLERALTQNRTPNTHRYISNAVYAELH